MTGMCLKKGNSQSHRERFSLLTQAISIIKNEEKNFNIQISSCTRGPLCTSLVRTAFSPGLKESLRGRLLGTATFTVG